MSKLSNEIVAIVSHGEQFRFVGEKSDPEGNGTILYIASRESFGTDIRNRKLETLCREHFPEKPTSMLSSQAGVVIMTYHDQEKVCVWIFDNPEEALKEYQSTC